LEAIGGPKPTGSTLGKQGISLLLALHRDVGAIARTSSSVPPSDQDRLIVLLRYRLGNFIFGRTHIVWL
jgi:hypothetical protein